VCGVGPSTLDQCHDLATQWLVPGAEGAPVVQRFCQACAPRGSVDEIACVRCGDGPLVAGELTVMDLQALLVRGAGLAGLTPAPAAIANPDRAPRPGLAACYSVIDLRTGAGTP